MAEPTITMANGVPSCSDHGPMEVAAAPLPESWWHCRGCSLKVRVRDDHRIDTYFFKQGRY